LRCLSRVVGLPHGSSSIIGNIGNVSCNVSIELGLSRTVPGMFYFVINLYLKMKNEKVRAACVG
jgi:hypothetical protein